MAGVGGVDERPLMVVVAGPNGSGKSSLIRHLDPADEFQLIDVDAIARERGLEPLAAGRFALGVFKDALDARRQLVIETTLSGKTLFRWMERARKAGYSLHLHFVAVENVELSLVRIGQRVGLGGHDIPEEDAIRRFPRSIANLPRALALCEYGRLYDNSGNMHIPVMEFRGGRLSLLTRERPAWLVKALEELLRA